MAVRQYLISYLIARICCIANQRFHYSDSKKYYNRSLIYNIMAYILNDEVHGKGMVAVSRREFYSIAVQLCKKVSCSER